MLGCSLFRSGLNKALLTEPTWAAGGHVAGEMERSFDVLGMLWLALYSYFCSLSANTHVPSIVYCTCYNGRNRSRRVYRIAFWAHVSGTGGHAAKQSPNGR